MSSEFLGFEDRPALAQALAYQIAAALAAGIAARGKASIAVSGGSTPKLLFKTLSSEDIDWEKVTITLVDERFVPLDSDRSNHRLVRDNLLTDKAAKASFVPLYYDVASIEESAVKATAETADIGNPFDVVVLGMGSDGHTASFFPGGNHLAAALDLEGPRGVMTMEAPGAGEPRLTFSLASLADAGFLILHIEGDEKKAVLEKARDGADEAEMPVRAVLNRAKTMVSIYWAP